MEKTLIEDEKAIKELNEKKLKKKVLAEKNTGLKETAKKCRKTATEKELWDCLDTLNKKFVQTKDQKQNKSNKNLIVYFIVKNVFFSLTRVKLNKKEEVKRLNNLSSNYPRLFYKEQAKDLDVKLPSVIAQQNSCSNTAVPGEQIEYQINSLTDEIDQGKISKTLEFYFSAENKDF